MLARLRHALPFVVGLALFMAALEVLRIELRAVSWHEITGDVLRTPASQLAGAIVLTILNYAALTGYDLLAFAYIRKPLHAPGFQHSPVASLWNRLGSFVYEHADAVYNFQGLRAYKDKFDPVWEPRYLAYPGGLRLPRIMADVSALVAGGYRHIFGK